MEKIIINLQKNKVLLIIVDVSIIIFSALVSIVARFSIVSIPEIYWDNMLAALPIDIILTITVFWAAHLYHSLWTYVSTSEMIRIFIAVTAVNAIEILYKSALTLNMPKSFYLANFCCIFILVLGSRLTFRLFRRYRNKYVNGRDKKNIMVIGAGSAGSLLIKEVMEQDENSKVVCIIDDSGDKIGKYLHGIKIVGDRDSIPDEALKHNVDEIIMAIPTASPSEISEIATICSKTECRVKTLPSIPMALNIGLTKKVREITFADLTNRDQAQVDQEGITAVLQGKTVMVTGGGGSIGSELCRQIMKYDPKRLIIFDIYENNAYEIEMELKRLYPAGNITVFIGSVRDCPRLECIFERYRPEVIYHAAAHKHVPLMESSPNEAIKNNCLGTLNVAKMADKYKAEGFVLISTDKAVRPTNMMGATKRICEVIVQMYARKSTTKFAAVRFGNVFGSNGSVIPLFYRQIEKGGPVTVTHKDITRYFMSITEAVSLVLQAGTFAAGGEIFVLNMGEPVRIYDLAEKLIRLKGFRPNVDIHIKITGLRPGEKLYEELLMDEEGLEKTPSELIFIGKPIGVDEEKFTDDLNALIDAALANADDIKERMAELCTSYTITENNQIESDDLIEISPQVKTNAQTG